METDELRSIEREDRDLGFGSVISRDSKLRLLNRDGSFNVARKGLGLGASLHLYSSLITMSWPRFAALAFAGYIVANVLFASGYLLCGPNALAGVDPGSISERWLDSFFFSVQTLSTVGYGHTWPMNLAANLLMTVEVMAGLFTLALGTGLVFARFSRPQARIAFSRKAIITPYRGVTAFEFRITNRRRTQIMDLHSRVILTLNEKSATGRKRRYYQLPLERRRVTFFPLSWTIVHPIDEKSPLWGVDRKELVASEAEFLVLLTGLDETFSQTVHARSSYMADEVEWAAGFESMFSREAPGAPLTIDVSRLDGVVSSAARESVA